ncbi:MAG: hypothetical protein WD066_18450 [Planctomycetaceae bacterium]
MRFASLSLGCILALAIIAGCERGPLRFKVVVEMDADPTTIDLEIAEPMITDLRSLPELRDVQAHSFEGRVEVYAVFDPPPSDSKFGENVEKRLQAGAGLPIEAGAPDVHLLLPSDVIQARSTRYFPTLRVTLRRERIVQLGVPVADVEEQFDLLTRPVFDKIQEEGLKAAVDDVKELQKAPIRVGDHVIPAEHLAEFQLVTRPICVVRTQDGIEPSTDR